MSFKTVTEKYFKRFGIEMPYAQFPLRKETKLIITIPSHNEPNFLATLDSLKKCIPTTYPVEILIIFNHSEQANEALVKQHEKAWQQVLEWQKKNQNNTLLRVQPLLASLPKKHAGVGLARKLVMDEALRLLAETDYDGLIVCLDADSKVASNYLIELEKAHLNTKQPQVFTINFEHIPSENEQLNEGIIYYELFLRYYIQGLKYAGFPYAMHTIGSSMACSAQHYALQGGMNRRKAGEDFYFLHKVTPHGNLKEIHSTSVLPSARISDRVPFGTGRAQQDWQQGSSKIASTYQPIIFEDLQDFFSIIESLYKNDIEISFANWLMDFLKEQQFESELKRIRKGSKSLAVFLKNFWAWFDGFKVLKAIHYARDTRYRNEPIEKVANELLGKIGVDFNGDVKSLLSVYRDLDKSII